MTPYLVCNSLPFYNESIGANGDLTRADFQTRKRYKLPRRGGKMAISNSPLPIPSTATPSLSILWKKRKKERRIARINSTRPNFYLEERLRNRFRGRGESEISSGRIGGKENYEAPFFPSSEKRGIALLSFSQFFSTTNQKGNWN